MDSSVDGDSAAAGPGLVGGSRDQRPAFEQAAAGGGDGAVVPRAPAASAAAAVEGVPARAELAAP